MEADEDGETERNYKDADAETCSVALYLHCHQSAALSASKLALSPCRALSAMSKRVAMLASKLTLSAKNAFADNALSSNVVSKQGVCRQQALGVAPASNAIVLAMH
jgi:hypothetical protein